jgi:diguanylate cyclase
MYTFEDILQYKKKIYETAWSTFVYLIKHRIDPTPENFKKYFDKFFEEDEKIENPIKKVLRKTNNVLGKTTNTLDEVVVNLKEAENKRVEAHFLDKVVKKLEKEKGSLENLRREIQKVEEDLEAVNRSMYIDPLTDVWNRLALEEFLPNLPKLSLERNIVVAFLDLNKFKQVNDTYGHLVGDKLLKHFANYLKTDLKRKDFIARYGGDEFVVILFDIDLEEAKKLFENLRKEFPPLKINGKTIKIDFCVGLTVPFGNDKPEEILNRADMAMYECKKTGKIGVKLK